MSTVTINPTCVAVRLTLHGRVQGLGVRPAVARLADECGLAGCVRNTLQGLQIELEGALEDVSRFREALPSALPEATRVARIESQTVMPEGRAAFRIVQDDADGPLGTPLPLDTAVCSECLAEAADARDRRAGYALISCAACGPRYTVIRSMPYERTATTLNGFPLCQLCEREYGSPADRRFHAQTTACPECGPHIWTVDRSGTQSGNPAEAVDIAVAALRSQRIVALRGVGGYQLLCDASSEAVVSRLRSRKHRPAKPLAVLVGSVHDAARIASLSHAERRMLADPGNPIVLLQSRESPLIAPAVHRSFDTIGVMLPTTALHFQIATRFGRPLVCTSANRDGEPLEYEVDAAQRALTGIADLWVHHDRPIARPVDDSVVRFIAGRPVTIRAARGIAPITLDLPAGPPTLALGAHQKGALAWCNGHQCVLGPHVGDLETLPARDRFVAHREALERLYRFRPEALAHDLHPDYFTTRLAAASATPRIAVPHHFAHLAAGMIEHGLLNEPALGVIWDGTGLGTDGTVWGGEFIIADSLRSMRRVAHLRPFPLIGGEAAVREPWRCAAALLMDALGCDALTQSGLAGVPSEQLRQLMDVAANPRLHPVTSSAGRLFDAAACLILSIMQAPFEGAPAMLLEAAADPLASGHYPFLLTAGPPPQLDWRPLIVALWNDLRRGTDPGVVAMRFHRTLARGIASVAALHAHLPVVLSGGVFQNRLLCELLLKELNGSERLKTPGTIPPNDGGIAAGQLAIALAASLHRG